MHNHQFSSLASRCTRTIPIHPSQRIKWFVYFFFTNRAIYFVRTKFWNMIHLHIRLFIEFCRHEAKAGFFSIFGWLSILSLPSRFTRSAARISMAPLGIIAIPIPLLLQFWYTFNILLSYSCRRYCAHCVTYSSFILHTQRLCRTVGCKQKLPVPNF